MKHKQALPRFLVFGITLLCFGAMSSMGLVVTTIAQSSSSSAATLPLLPGDPSAQSWSGSSSPRISVGGGVISPPSQSSSNSSGSASVSSSEPSISTIDGSRSPFDGPSLPGTPEFTSELLADNQDGQPAPVPPEYDYSIKDIYLKVRTYTSSDGVNWELQPDPEFDTWQLVSCGDQSPLNSFPFKGVNDNRDSLSAQSYIQAMEEANNSPFVFALASVRFTNRLCDHIVNSATGRVKTFDCYNKAPRSLFPRDFNSSSVFTTYDNPNETPNMCLGFNATNYNTINYTDNIAYLSLDRYIFEFPEGREREFSQQYQGAFKDGLVHQGIEMIYPQYTHKELLEDCTPTNNDLSGIVEVCDLNPNPDPNGYIDWVNPNENNIFDGWLAYPLQGSHDLTLLKPLKYNSDGTMKWSLDRSVLSFTYDNGTGEEYYIYSPYGEEFVIPDAALEKSIVDVNGDGLPEELYEYTDNNNFALEIRVANDKISGVVQFQGGVFNINNHYDLTSQEFGRILDAEQLIIYGI
jgi:hypothetical protein